MHYLITLYLSIGTFKKLALGWSRYLDANSASTSPLASLLATALVQNQYPFSFNICAMHYLITLYLSIGPFKKPDLGWSRTLMQTQHLPAHWPVS